MAHVDRSGATGSLRKIGRLTLVLCGVALLLTGAIAGFFYAYSSSVMRGLDAAEPAVAIAAMQGINAQVRNAVFAPAFFGAPVACLLAAASLAWSGARRPALFMALAALVYLAGALYPTFAVNVAMNDTLAAATIPSDPAAARALWAEYSERWTTWNHLRAGFSFVSLLLVGTAIYLTGRQRLK